MVSVSARSVLPFCQIGAAVMGEAGKTYDDILLFYYRHAEISKLYE